MFNRRGQNIAEYSILISLVIAAAVAMNTYVKRGLQGRVRNAVDHVESAEGTVVFTGEQYEPYYVQSSANQTQTKSNSDTWGNNGQITRTGIDDRSAVLQGSVETTLAPQNN